MTDTPIDHALAVAERLARNVIPDLDGAPLYLVQPAEGSLVTRGGMGGAAGMYHSGLDFALRPQLEAEGRWRGPGAAVVVDALAIFAGAANDGDGLRRVAGVVLHELSHWLDLPPRECTEVDAGDIRERLSCPETERNGGAAYSHGWPVGLIWHDDVFCRIVAHLWWRCRTVGGLPLAPRYLGFGADYRGLEMCPTPEQIIDALWGEFAEFAELELPLRKLEKLKPPAPYRRLWDRVYNQLEEPQTQTTKPSLVKG